MGWQLIHLLTAEVLCWHLLWCTDGDICAPSATTLCWQKLSLQIMPFADSYCHDLTATVMFCKLWLLLTATVLYWKLLSCAENCFQMLRAANLCWQLQSCGDSYCRVCCHLVILLYAYNISPVLTSNITCWQLRSCTDNWFHDNYGLCWQLLYCADRYLTFWMPLSCVDSYCLSTHFLRCADRC